MATFNDALANRLNVQKDAFQTQKNKAFEETDRLEKQRQKDIAQSLQRSNITDSGIGLKQKRLSRADTTQALEKRLSDIDIEAARQRETLSESERQRQFLTM